MSVVKPALRNPQARTDIENAIDFYLPEAPHTVDPFIDVLEKATRHLQRAPGMGWPRYAHALEMSALGFWTLNKYPYTLCDLEHEDHVWVNHLMHMSQDTPTSLQA